MNNTDLLGGENTRVYIGLGANLDEPKQQLKSALFALSQIPNSKLCKQSSFYSSKPMGPQDQDDYINAVAELETELQPLELLDQLQSIEQEHGRVRKGERWGPRTLDLDLLTFHNLAMDHPRLTIPHYGIKERNFVLLPLAEIAPNLQLPDGSSISQLAKTINKQGIKKL